LIKSSQKNGHVYAFEPHPEAIDLLRRNVSLNGFENVSIVERAVINEEKRVFLDVSTASDKSSILSSKSQKSSIEVESIELDTWSKDKRPPDVVKVDVEGAEIETLRGAKRMIKRHRPLLIIEVHRIGSRFQKFVSKELNQLGYSASTLQGDELPDRDGIRYHAVLRP
jgi:FkbM family methyltransferase